ncbi:MAG: hypothetical protein E7424_02775 [Ruminococcaceae bacterium]|jgi:hypothetical protein|nr:hypothetical protein [Oscillospiraceae bacterium]
MDIDLVVLWVDGNDPAWRAEKDKYDTSKKDDSNSDERFRDWGLMKYWFRGIESFLPWIRKVHFVTWGHVPDFLNLNHPKLHLVNHKDFLPADALPTFNACAIEMNIHRIEGLAEHFIYFNDDMFVLRPMKEEAFFVDGLPCAYVSEYSVPFKTLETFEYLTMNGLGVINRHFYKKDQVKKYRKKYINKAYTLKENIRTLMAELFYKGYFVGFSHHHAPAAFLKETFVTLWKKEYDLLWNTTRHRFRDPKDLNQWVAIWWQAARGQFQPYPVDNYMRQINQETIADVCGTIKNQTHCFLCINDRAETAAIEEYAARIAEAFETILPEKSGFEKA